jgi:hypothetical protein
MYLVDGSKLWYTNNSGTKVYVGRNPMTASEYSLWSTNCSYDTEALPSGVTLSSPAFDIKAVKYVNNGDEYYYVYWNFASVDDAVKFFKSKYTTTDNYLKQRLSLLNGGSIILQSRSDKEVYTKGNLITKNGEDFGYVTPTTGTTLSDVETTFCQDQKLIYGNLKSSLAPETRIGNDLFADALFTNKRMDMAGIGRCVELTAPSSWNTGDIELNVNKDSKGFTEVDVHTGYCIYGTGDQAEKDSNTYKYYLVTGSNIVINDTATEASINDNTVTFSPEDNAKYIVVSSGDVTVNAPGCTFNGIIFANGNVNIKAIGEMNCFGNYCESVTTKKLTLNELGKITKIENGDSEDDQYISEFDAVLGVNCHDANVNHPNSILRKLFNVIDTSAGSDEGGTASEISLVGVNNYSKK